MASRKKRKKRSQQAKMPQVVAQPLPSRPLPWRVILLVVLVVAGAMTLKILVANRNTQVADKPSPAKSKREKNQPPASSPPRDSEPSQIALGQRQNRKDSKVDKLAELIDPAKDQGWETEVLNEAAGSQLKALAKLIAHPKLIDAAHVRPLVDDAFTSHALRPEKTEPVLDDGNLTVRRSPEKSQTASEEPPSFHGPAGFAEALGQLVAPMPQSDQAHCKLKLFKIEKSEEFFTTQQYFQASSHDERQGTQLSALWHCRWSYPNGASQPNPRLLAVEVDRYEEIVTETVQGKHFVDCTESALKANESYQSHVLRGLNHWVTRLSRLDDLSLFGYHGIAVGDVNGDGLEDLYVCEDGGLPNRLYLQQADGTLKDFSRESRTDWLDSSASALLVDLDNDGDQDLALAARPQLILMENDGRGRFTMHASDHALTAATSLTAADYDDDGDLDLYVCNYLPDPKSRQLPLPIPYQDANNGGPNYLFMNEGDFHFTDVTEEMGLNENNTRFSLAAAWEDYDNDGDLDLYVANDYGRNNLYRNEGGRFSDVAASAGAEDVASGMSVSWGDYNRDGQMDLYVSNMFSAAGNRIAFQRNFSTGSFGQREEHMQRMARGNTLFANQSGGTFRDVSEQAEVTMGRWAWASKFVDLNNDGWQDLLVTNGFVTNTNTGDL